MSIKRDLELLFEIGTLRRVARTWNQFLSPDFANVAEHTFRVLWVAILIAHQEEPDVPIDYEKLLKLALVHDITEARTGDVHYLSRLYTKRDEAAAITDQLAGTALTGEWETLWHEYEARESKEAQIVKDADTLDVDLELVEQSWRGHRLRDDWQENRLAVVGATLFTKAAKKLQRAIYAANPHDWHELGKNRYSAGDWQK